MKVVGIRNAPGPQRVLPRHGRGGGEGVEGVERIKLIREICISPLPELKMGLHGLLMRTVMR